MSTLKYLWKKKGSEFDCVCVHINKIIIQLNKREKAVIVVFLLGSSRTEKLEMISGLDENML